jgi:hypothetical protein
MVDSKSAQTGVTLSEDGFALLCEFFNRWHTSTCDPKFVGQTGKIGEKLMRRIQEIAQETYGQPAPPGAALPPPRTASAGSSPMTTTDQSFSPEEIVSELPERPAGGARQSRFVGGVFVRSSMVSQRWQGPGGSNGDRAGSRA